MQVLREENKPLPNIPLPIIEDKQLTSILKQPKTQLSPQNQKINKIAFITFALTLTGFGLIGTGLAGLAAVPIAFGALAGISLGLGIIATAYVTNKIYKKFYNSSNQPTNLSPNKKTNVRIDIDFSKQASQNMQPLQEKCDTDQNALVTQLEKKEQPWKEKTSNTQLGITDKQLETAWKFETHNHIELLNQLRRIKSYAANNPTLLSNLEKFSSDILKELPDKDKESYKKAFKAIKDKSRELEDLNDSIEIDEFISNNFNFEKSADLVYGKPPTGSKTEVDSRARSDQAAICDIVAHAFREVNLSTLSKDSFIAIKKKCQEEIQALVEQSNQTIQQLNNVLKENANFLVEIDEKLSRAIIKGANKESIEVKKPDGSIKNVNVLTPIPAQVLNDLKAEVGLRLRGNEGKKSKMSEVNKLLYNYITTKIDGINHWLKNSINPRSGIFYDDDLKKIKGPNHPAKFEKIDIRAFIETCESKLYQPEKALHNVNSMFNYIEEHFVKKAK